MRCWREWTVVRRDALRARSIARAHGDVIRVFCALRAWALVHQQQQPNADRSRTLRGRRREGSDSVAVVRWRSRAEVGAERVWYMFWRNRMRGELQLQLVTRLEWDLFWSRVPI